VHSRRVDLELTATAVLALRNVDGDRAVRAILSCVVLQFRARARESRPVASSGVVSPSRPAPRTAAGTGSGRTETSACVGAAAGITPPVKAWRAYGDTLAVGVVRAGEAGEVPARRAVIR